jgi:GYF domain 2
MAPDETLLQDDPRLDGGEWLFRRDGHVFGPIDSRALAAMLYRGEIDARTAVSSGDGAWSALGEVPAFLVHAKKAAAGLRVEREVTGSRMLRARANRRRLVLFVVTAVVLVVGAGGGALWFARRSAATSPLLEDFGAGIRIASAARVGVSTHDAEDEFEVPIDAREPSGAPPQRRRTRPAPAPGPAARGPAAGSVDGGELVAASFDPRKIQQVVGREQRNLAPCFRAEAERSPEFRGNVPIEFVIGNDGKVSQLWIDEPQFKEGPLRECLVKALAAWRFDSFPGQRPTVSLAFGIGR